MNCTHCGGNLKKIGETQDDMILYQCLDCGKRYKMAKPSPTKSAATVTSETQLPKKYRMMTFWEYIGYSLFYLLPIVGWAFLIADACDKKYLNRMHFARFYILPTIVVTGVAIFFLAILGLPIVY